jgi:hypothetical protein
MSDLAEKVYKFLIGSLEGMGTGIQEILSLDEIASDEITLNDLGITLKRPDEETFSCFSLYAFDGERQKPKLPRRYCASAFTEDMAVFYACMRDPRVNLDNKVKLFDTFLQKAEGSQELDEYLTPVVCADIIDMMCSRSLAPTYFDLDRMRQLREAADSLRTDPISNDCRYAFFHELLTNAYPELTIQSQDPRY